MTHDEFCSVVTLAASRPAADAKILSQEELRQIAEARTYSVNSYSFPAQVVRNLLAIMTRLTPEGSAVKEKTE